MKKLILFILLIYSNSLFCQTFFADSITVFDSCKEKYENALIEYDSLFYYPKKLSSVNNIWHKHYMIDKAKVKSDTIYLPKLTFATDGAIHYAEWAYLFCNKIAKGMITEYYPNGNIHYKGEFVNGKPKYIFTYNENGVIELKEFYKLGFMNRIRINYYDEYGILIEYEINKIKKRSVVIKTYDSENSLINKKVIKTRIEKQIHL